MKLAIFILICLIVHFSVSKDLRKRRQVKKCEDSCILLRDCDPYQDMLRNKDPKSWQIIREKKCGREGFNLKVCCPQMPDSQDAFFPTDCGRNIRPDKIVFGEKTSMGEFPWAVALEYKKPDKHHTVILCSGSLINARYVLTAAHCVDKNKFKGFELLKIRLGDWNLTSKTDCYESQHGEICAPPYISAKPEKIIPHSMYGIRHEDADDIALIRLDRTINFNEAEGYIQPVCLPSFGIQTELLVRDRNPIVIGWGKTENMKQSDVLLKAEVPFAERDLCTRYFYSNFGEKQLCVGGEEKDSCSGDSGSPLLLEGPDVSPYLQIGIVSFGTLKCGVPGIPAVYTSVSHYKKWLTYSMESW